MHPSRIGFSIPAFEDELIKIQMLPTPLSELQVRDAWQLDVYGFALAVLARAAAADPIVELLAPKVRGFLLQSSSSESSDRCQARCRSRDALLSVTWSAL